MIQKIKNKFSEDSHFKELMSGAFSAFSLRIAGMAIGYLSLLYITNTYGASSYGVLALCITILSIFTLFPKFGMENALVRIIGELYTHENIDEINKVLKKVLTFTFILSTLSAILLYSFSSFIAETLLHKPNLIFYLKILSIGIFSTVFITISAGYFQGIRQTKTFVFIQVLLNQVVFLALLLQNNFFKLTTNLVSIYVMATIFSALTALYFLYKETLHRTTTNKKTYKQPMTYDLAKIIHLATPMLFAGSFAMLMSWTDIIMIGMYMSESDIGVYTAAQRVAGLTSLSLVAINAIAAPKFVQFYAKKDIEGLEKIAKQSTKLIFFTSFPLLVIYFLFSQNIMAFFGTEFITGAMTLIILSIGQFINAISGSVGYIMQMTDNQKIFQNVIITASFLNIVLNTILIPKIGIEGAAVASIISMIYWNIVLVFFIRKKLGFWTICLL